MFEILYIIILCRDRLKKYEGDSCLPYPGEKPVEYNNMAPGGEADYDTRVGEVDYSLRGGAGNSNYRHMEKLQHCDSGGERQLTALA